MKRLNYLSTIAAVSAVLYAANSVRAGEPLLSPRARSNQIRVEKGSGTQNPNLLAGLPTGNAKGWALLQSVRTVPKSGADIDLAHIRPALSPKDPRNEIALREMATYQFQVAPIK
jgi:hypothetical protein